MAEFLSHPYPWHQSQWQDFSLLLAQGKFPHAVMLAGPRDIGKLQLARALAYRLLCEMPLDNLACGQCRACLLNKAETHPDLLFLSPEEGSKSIKVDQVRDLTQFLSKTAQQGGYKLVIVEPVEAMNANASNALLKSLEEPSGQTILLLVCHNPSMVLPTIRSRCQMRLLPLPARQMVLSWLGPMVPPGISAENLLLESNGAPLAALALLQSDQLEKRASRLQDWTRLTMGQRSAIDIAADWQDQEPITLLEWYLNWLLAISKWQVGSVDTPVHNAPDDWRQALTQVSPNLLHRYIEKVLVNKRQLLGGANPNKQLLLEELLMDWTALVRASRQTTLAAGQV